MTEWLVALSVIAVVLTLLGAAVMATWVAGRVQSATAALGAKIDGLGSVIVRLTDKLDGHDERLRHVEDESSTLREQVATLQREMGELRGKTGVR